MSVADVSAVATDLSYECDELGKFLAVLAGLQLK